MNIPQPFSTTECTILTNHLDAGAADFLDNFDPTDMLANLRQIDVVFRDDGSGQLKATLWGMARPVELALRGVSEPHGSLTISSRPNGIVLPVSAESPPDGLIMFSAQTGQTKLGILLVPTSVTGIDALMPSLAMLAQTDIAGIETADPRAINFMDMLMNDLHLLVFSFTDGKKPEKFFNFNNGAELASSIQSRKEAIQLLKAA